MSSVFTEEDERVMMEAAQRLMRMRSEAEELLEHFEMLELIAKVREIPAAELDILEGHLFILRYCQDKIRNIRVMASLAEHKVRYWL